MPTSEIILKCRNPKTRARIRGPDDRNGLIAVNQWYRGARVYDIRFRRCTSDCQLFFCPSGTSRTFRVLFFSREADIFAVGYRKTVYE